MDDQPHDALDDYSADFPLGIIEERKVDFPVRFTPEFERFLASIPEDQRYVKLKRRDGEREGKG